MNLAQPHEAVAPSLHGAVLVALHTAAQPLSGRAVAERAGASHEGTRRVLRNLVVHGLVDTIETAGAILYSLNQDHVLADAVSQLTRARTALFERMVEEIRTWKPRPLNVTVFGSAARGTGDVDSDVDVFVVRRDDVPPGFSHWDEHLPELAHAIERWSGNRAEIIEYSLAELREAARANVPFVDAVTREGLPVFGKHVRRLLIEAGRAAG